MFWKFKRKKKHESDLVTVDRNLVLPLVDELAGWLYVLRVVADEFEDQARSARTSTARSSAYQKADDCRNVVSKIKQGFEDIKELLQCDI